MSAETPDLALPLPIAAYFAAVADGADATARCFTEGASVLDERHEYRGRASVARWKAVASAKYHYASVPLAVDVSGDTTTVIARVTGDFPGSPIELRHCFVLDGDKIASLRIAS